MEIEDIKKFIDQGLTYPEISKILKIPRTTLISRCIKEGFRYRDYLKSKQTDVKLCFKCKELKSINDFYIKENNNACSYCKDCNNKLVLNKKRELKKICVEYKGGCCQHCGYSKCIGALHFHHLDNKNKKFSISQITYKVFNDIIKNELDKCILLCANCHAEEHYRNYMS